MTAKKKRGYFITLEGGEGTGKTTQIKKLAAALKKAGHQVVVTREPGGSPGAEAVRHVLLSGAGERYGPEIEAVLFSAARADHVATLIRPNLKTGKTVICDRFYDSTRVYQGVTGNVDIAFLKDLEEVACGPVRPNLTLILDIDPRVGLDRATKRRKKSEAPDRFEKETLTLQDKRRQGFLDIAKQEPERCAVIDASGSEDEVFARIWEAVEDRLTVGADDAASDRAIKAVREELTTFS